MSDWSETHADPQAEQYEPYRTVSKTGLGALALGGAGAGLGLLFYTTEPVVILAAVLSAVGLLCSVISLRSIRRFPLEFAGKPAAVMGAVFSLVGLVGAPSLFAFCFVTEIPSDYKRVSFDQLKSEPRGPEIPPAPALDLDGQKVFIRGYVYPGGQQTGIKRFIMVSDLGTCCFGGQPQLTHMVLVTLQDPLRVDYALRKRGLGGILKVDRRLKPVSGVGGVYYQLDADFVK